MHNILCCFPVMLKMLFLSVVGSRRKKAICTSEMWNVKLSSWDHWQVNNVWTPRRADGADFREIFKEDSSQIESISKKALSTLVGSSGRALLTSNILTNFIVEREFLWCQHESRGSRGGSLERLEDYLSNLCELARTLPRAVKWNKTSCCRR